MRRAGLSLLSHRPYRPLEKKKLVVKSTSSNHGSAVSPTKRVWTQSECAPRRTHAIPPALTATHTGTMPRSPMRPAHAVFALSLLTYICPSALSPTAPLTPLTPASARCPLRLKTDATAPARVKPSRAAALRMRGGSSALNDAELYLESVGVRAPMPPAPLTRTGIISAHGWPCFVLL